MIRKFLFILVSLCVMSNIAFADEVSDILTSSTDYQTTSYGVCRKVKDGYTTQITGYDFINGITFCEIIPNNNESLPIPKTINANTLYYEGSYTYRINNQQSSDKDGVLSALKKKASEVGNSVASTLGINSSDFVIEEVEDKAGMTLSAYLASLAVLKDIDAKDTAGKVVTRVDFKTGQEQSQVVGQTAQGFNQSNIDYFKNLYNNLNEVYIHLQNLLFIVVGGFFLATLGGGKIQKYLENRGQSTGNKEPYLHKFFIPLLCAGVFYMPITSGGGVNSTMVQNIIQYFTMEANNIADVASNIGSQAYVRKMTENIGVNYGDLSEDLFKGGARYEQAMHIKEQAKKQIDEVCKKAYTDQRSFMDEEKYNYIEEAAKKEISGNDGFLAGFFKKAKKVIDDMFKPETDKLITKDACKQLTNKYYEALRTIEKIENSDKAHQKELTKKQTDSVNTTRDTLTTINKRIRENERDFGWINSLIVPSSALMFEIQSAYKVAARSIDNKDFESLAKERDKVVKAKGKDIDKDDDSDTPMSDSTFTQLSRWLTKNLLYLTLPGANTIRTMLDNFGVNGNGEVEGAWTTAARMMFYYGLCGYTTSQILTNSNEYLSIAETAAAGAGIGLICTPAGWDKGISSFLVSGIFTITLFKAVLEYLPIIIVCVASVLAFLSYFVTLCKYFYISPFVVAFALTTKRVDKIINFLITGITIFFKPVLIVIFIYLALFLLYIVEEIFVMAGINQFNVLPSADLENAIDYGTNITVGIIQALLMFLASLSSIYIVWKTIMTGPDWVFKLLGLDNNSDNTIVQQMSSKLETKAVVV